MSERRVRAEWARRRWVTAIGVCVISIVAIAGGTLAAARDSSGHQTVPDSSLLQRMLDNHGGNVTRAAESAGVARRYFQILKARVAKKKDGPDEEP